MMDLSWEVLFFVTEFVEVGFNTRLVGRHEWPFGGLLVRVAKFDVVVIQELPQRRQILPIFNLLPVHILKKSLHFQLLNAQSFLRVDFQ